MNPPTSEIITRLLLGVVIITLLLYIVYIAIKKCESRITCRQALRPEIIELKSAISATPRFVLLLIVMTLPLSILTISTQLSIAFVIDSLLDKIRSPLPVCIEIPISFLYLLANIILMHYFLGNYGSIYKLSFIAFVRKDIRQLLKKRIDLRIKLLFIHMALLMSSIMYAMAIFSFLTDLINTPSVLSKIGTSIIIALLLVYVLPNKKYENAIKLIEKIWR